MQTRQCVQNNAGPNAYLASKTYEVQHVYTKGCYQVSYKITWINWHMLDIMYTSKQFRKEEAAVQEKHNHAHASLDNIKGKNVTLIWTKDTNHSISRTKLGGRQTMLMTVRK